jgi:hypothetical protein
VIAKAELFPVLVCRATLSIHPAMTLMVHYFDNDGVSDSPVKGTSAISSLRDMLHEYALQELHFSLVSWIARVASAYRWRALSPESASWCIVVVYCPLSRSANLVCQPALVQSWGLTGFPELSGGLEALSSV